MTMRKPSHPKRNSEERVIGSVSVEINLTEETRRVMQSDTIKYEDMHEKLNIMAMKFNHMKANLASKREDKKHFLLIQQR
jgi:hypothetical protein